MLKVGTIDGKLVVGVELGLVDEAGAPRVWAVGFQDVHAMIDGWTVVWTIHVYLGRRRVAMWVSSEDDVPGSIEIMEFGGP